MDLSYNSPHFLFLAESKIAVSETGVPVSALAIFQVAIALGAVAALTRMQRLWIASLVLGISGTVLLLAILVTVRKFYADSVLPVVNTRYLAVGACHSKRHDHISLQHRLKSLETKSGDSWREDQT